MSNETIAEQSADVSASIAAQAPAHVLDGLAAGSAAFVAAGVPALPAAGSPMPDGALLDVNGAPASIAAARDGKAAVVVFYRGVWCPFCNVALQTYERELVPALTARGVVLIAISPEKPDGSRSMQQKHALTFATLSDPGNTIAKQLGIGSTAIEPMLQAQRDLGIDVRQHNADGTPELPMPATIVVDASGAIRWTDVHPAFTTRSEVADILAAVDAL